MHIKRVLATLVVSLSLFATPALSQPRVYPDDVMDDLSLLYDVINAYIRAVDVNDPDQLQFFEGRSPEDFDRNRSGGFVLVGGDALLDVDLALQQAQLG